MKYTSLFLVLLLALNVFAQDVRVVSIEAVTKVSDGIFCCPQMDESGTGLFFTTPGYKGLYYYDLIKQNRIQISDDLGAGYEPAINSDGTETLYRTYSIKDGRRYYSIVKVNTRTKEKTLLENARRVLSVPRLFTDGTIAYSLHSILKKNTRYTIRPDKQNSGTQAAVFIENRKIALFVNGQKRLLEPRGSGSYIWPEISPSGKHLLFKKLGDGCYVSDLEGRIISSLGNINAPQWSPDGYHIVYMKDTDDGRRITSSEIHIINADGSNDVQLTSTENSIELYPRWGNDTNTIVFSTAKGQIYLMHLEWK